jgi:alpha-galactosidase
MQWYYYLTGDAGEHIEKKALPRAAEAGVDVYWIDALWYGDRQEWWDCVGSWVVNRKRFPNGLRPISDAARAAGMKFLLWFEPGRVREHAILNKEHPEFMLKREADPDNLLYNMGMPEAREYLTDLISGCITEHGVDIYRQDFNFDPLPYWEQADEPDRIGMTEIRYVEGFYEFWDELRRRHPNIWIDNCSSGGRRIDLETMSRSLPLWPSDFPDACSIHYGMGLHVGDQCINAGLSRWIPFFGGGVWNFTPYGTRGEIVGGFTYGVHIDHKHFAPDTPAIRLGYKEVAAHGKTPLDDDFPIKDVKAAVAEWRGIREFFTGDFHLLLPLTVLYHDWCAWQFHREDLGAGIAMFFRRHRSPFPSMQVTIKRIDPDADYEVSLSPCYGEAGNKRMKGRDLANMTITMPESPDSLLLRYRVGGD